ncbi:iron-containing alcohol dehydrogenase [Bacteroidetes/Chlorobi group bacterium Naka2016]|jgi:alcohol dehydrogenase YqhD (iron-dependent ADH family)|nr:MAG: iron-containing alcohol dehydrogenase [Bacteroidetes/Chlorobi group bacterium Naka2016]
MQNFVFHNPTKVIFGKGTIPTIGKEIAKFNVGKVLLLAGGGSIKNNRVYQQVVDSLRANKIEWIEHWGVRANPVLSHANEGIRIIKEKGLEGILAVGGGSVIDEGKSIAAGVFLDNLWDAFERKVNITKALPIFTVLTISATCSEMDPYAVLTNEEENKKWNIGSPVLYPKVSVVDPSVQFTLPWHQTVYGAIDALSHIMEFYFQSKGEEPTTSLDETLILNIFRSVDTLQKDPKNYDARATLAWSAILALNGFSAAGLYGGDWACHTIEHGISALHPEVAHGAGLAVVFPAWIKYIHPLNEPTFLRWAKNIFNKNNVESAVVALKEKYKSWGAPVSLRDLNITKDEISKIAEIIYKATEIRNIGEIKNLDYNDIIEILKIAY